MTWRNPERGTAMVLAVAATLLMLVLGGALVLVTSTETRIAARFARNIEVLYAAEAALERALVDLAALPDWDAALAGAAVSTLTDGAPGGVRIAGAAAVDIDAWTNRLRCGREDACAPGEMAAITADRPWGDNNPRWQLYAWGPLTALAPVPAGHEAYVLVWVGDDPGETDADPLRDGGGDDNPGRRTLVLVAQAVAPGGLRRVLEVTVRRRQPDVEAEDGGMPPAAGEAGLTVLAWREVR